MWFRIFLAIQFISFLSLYFSEALSGFLSVSIGALFFGVVLVLPVSLLVAYQVFFRRFDLKAENSEIKEIVNDRYGSKVPGVIFKAITQEGLYRVYKKILKPTEASVSVSNKPFAKLDIASKKLNAVSTINVPINPMKGFIPLGGDSGEKDAEASKALERSKFARRLIAKRDVQDNSQEAEGRTRIASSIHSFPTRDNVTNAYSDK